MAVQKPEISIKNTWLAFLGVLSIMLGVTAIQSHLSVENEAGQIAQVQLNTMLEAREGDLLNHYYKSFVDAAVENFPGTFIEIKGQGFTIHRGALQTEQACRSALAHGTTIRLCRSYESPLWLLTGSILAWFLFTLVIAVFFENRYLKILRSIRREFELGTSSKLKTISNKNRNVSTSKTAQKLPPQSSPHPNHSVSADLE